MSRRHRTVAVAFFVSVAALGTTALPAPATATGVFPASRQSRATDVVIAGANVYVWSTHRDSNHGGGCTLSFAVRSTVTHRPGSLTAGHCVRTLAGGPSYTVHETQSGKGNTTDPGIELGRIAANGYQLGRYGDSAFVASDLGKRPEAQVFTDGIASSTTIPVAGLATLRDGIRVCYSGAASGEHCGFRVVGRPEQVTFAEGRRTYRIRHEWRATRGTCTSRLGDSGSPVYIKRHGFAYAVGILSGGQKKSGECPFFFTPVTLALKHLGVRLLTARASVPISR